MPFSAASVPDSEPLSSADTVFMPFAAVKGEDITRYAGINGAWDAGCRVGIKRLRNREAPLSA